MDPERIDRKDHRDRQGCGNENTADRGDMSARCIVDAFVQGIREILTRDAVLNDMDPDGRGLIRLDDLS